MQTLLVREKETVFSYRFPFCRIKSTVWTGYTYQSTELASDCMCNFCHFPQIDNLPHTKKKQRDQRETNKSLQIYEQKLLLNRKSAPDI